MNKKVKLIYFSATNNTSVVLKAISSKISNEVEEYDITLPENRIKKLDFDENDIVIIGVPVYAGRVPKFLTPYINKIKGNKTKAVFVVTYGNRDYEDALLELKDVFEENGFVGIAGATFVGEHSSTSLLATNRPNYEDIYTALKFGEMINEKLNSIKSMNSIKKLEVPGNYPYVVKSIAMAHIAPETSEVCVQCKLCYRHCPTKAISLDDCKVVNVNKCIKCCSCVKRCPLIAKSINHPGYKNMQSTLVNNFSSLYRKPELFI
ncbi:MAG: EFR1 family ferrodoxin [Peptostreptococcaceae bacterium]